MCYAQVAPPGRACGQRQPQGLRSSECGKRSRKLGLQGEGEEREQKSHLDRVEQNKTKTRMRSRLGSGSRRRGVQSPLAGHLLPLLLVPADFGRVQLLRGQGGTGRVLRCPPHHSPWAGPKRGRVTGRPGCRRPGYAVGRDRAQEGAPAGRPGPPSPKQLLALSPLTPGGPL